MYYVRIEKIFYDMQGLHFTSNNHFLGSYWGMCSTKTKRMSQEGGRHGKQEAGRGRGAAQHDGEGASRSTERPTPTGGQQGLRGLSTGKTQISNGH